MTETPDEQVRSARSRALAAADLQPALIVLYALILSVLIGGVLIALVGINPLDAYWELIKGMVGTPDRVAGSVARSVPYIGSALAVAIAFRAGLFNIGGEGQLLVGGALAAWVGTWGLTHSLPAVFAITLVMLAGMVGGGAWGFVPGALRVTTGAHEVITTIMLNSIALLLIRWMVSSKDPRVLGDPEATVPRTAEIASSAQLPVLADSNPPLHIGLFFLVAACFAAAYLLNRTTLGFEISTVGANSSAATYAGVNVSRITIVAMTLAGSMAGLAAASEVAGTNHTYQTGTFMAMGFDGIAIALLAKAKPVPIIFAALLWGSMLAGAPTMQQNAGVSIDIVRIVQALVLLFVAADGIVRYLFRVPDTEDQPIEAVPS